MILSTILAALLTLAPGYNNPGVAGEVVAIAAATSNATATVTIKAVDSLTLYTNATAEVVRYEPAWAVTYTNFDGAASVNTNVVGYLDYSAFTTNGVSKIIGEPVAFDLPITNTITTAALPFETYSVTNEIASLTCADHFGSVSTNAFLFGNALVVEGAQDGDTVKILLR